MKDVIITLKKKFDNYHKYMFHKEGGVSFLGKGGKETSSNLEHNFITKV